MHDNSNKDLFKNSDTVMSFGCLFEYRVVQARCVVESRGSRFDIATHQSISLPNASHTDITSRKNTLNALVMKVPFFTL